MKKMLVWAAVVSALILFGGSASAATGDAGKDNLDWMPGFNAGPVPAPDDGGTAAAAPSGPASWIPRGRGKAPEDRKDELERIKKQDPERYARLMKIKELATEYRDCTDDKRKREIEKEIRPLVEEELRIQQEQNKKRVEELEKRLERMKKVLAERDKNWDKVVDFTVDEVLGKNDYLKAWPGSRNDKPKKQKNQDK